MVGTVKSRKVVDPKLHVPLTNIYTAVEKDKVEDVLNSSPYLQPPSGKAKRLVS